MTVVFVAWLGATSGLLGEASRRLVLLCSGLESKLDMPSNSAAHPAAYSCCMLAEPAGGGAIGAAWRACIRGPVLHVLLTVNTGFHQAFEFVMLHDSYLQSDVFDVQI